jgi:hypothetical protein
MSFSEMLSRVALVRTDVSEIHMACIISVFRLLVNANVPSSPILVALMIEALRSSKTSFLTRATRRNIPEDGILQVIITLHIEHYFLLFMSYPKRLQPQHDAGANATDCSS